MRAVIHRFALGLTLAGLLENNPAPAQTKDAPAPASGDNRVGFVTDEAGLTVLKRPVSPAWREGHPPSDEEFSPLCLAPCEARLDASPYQFALRRGDGPILPGALAYEISEPTTFRASVISRADTRQTGWYVFGIVSGAGVISTTTALMITC